MCKILKDIFDEGDENDSDEEQNEESIQLLTDQIFPATGGCNFSIFWR